MLLDFVDVVQTNLYVLGHTFLKLVRLLDIRLPIIDPSLYMHRFAAKLEYGEKKNTVAMTALRIAARMQRDWMTHGRRPAGLCGAALLTASVMHNFYRTQAEIARVVRIGNVVLRNRLRELDRTSTAKMTAVQIDAGGGDDGKQASLTVTEAGTACDPPAFAASQARKATIGPQSPTDAAAETGQRESNGNADNSASGSQEGAEKEETPENNGDGVQGGEQNEQQQVTRKKAPSAADLEKQAVETEEVDILMKKAMASKEMRALDKESTMEQNIEAELQKNAESGEGGANNEGESPTRLAGSKRDWVPDEQDVELSDLDDDETAKYISTEAEYKRKEELWTETNRDYLEQQERMEELKRERPEEYERLHPGRGKKRRKSNNNATKSRSGTNKNNANERREETPPPAPKPSKKLNYSVLQSLEHGGGLDEVAAG